MSQSLTFHALDLKPFVASFFPALRDARDKASLSPLREYLPEVPDEEKHVLTGKRYIVFGPEVRKLIGVGRLTSAAVRHASGHTVNLGDHCDNLLGALNTSGGFLVEREILESFSHWSFGLEDWMKDEVGPSLFPAKTFSNLMKNWGSVCDAPLVKRDAEKSCKLLEAAFSHASSGGAFTYSTVD